MEQNINRDVDNRMRGNINIDSQYRADGLDRPVEHGDSWKVMFEHLYTDLNRLVQREGQLIRTEMKEKISDVKKASVSMAIGGSLLFVGLFALVATSIILLDYVMALGLAAVIVTAVLFIVGGIMVGGAKKKLEAEKLKPHQSIDTLSEIKTTFKERINEYKSHHH